jgi:hypothetical protein
MNQKNQIIKDKETLLEHSKHTTLITNQYNAIQNKMKFLHQVLILSLNLI